MHVGTLDLRCLDQCGFSPPRWKTKCGETRRAGLRATSSFSGKLSVHVRTAGTSPLRAVPALGDAHNEKVALNERYACNCVLSRFQPPLRDDCKLVIIRADIAGSPASLPCSRIDEHRGSRRSVRAEKFGICRRRCQGKVKVRGRQRSRYSCGPERKGRQSTKSFSIAIRNRYILNSGAAASTCTYVILSWAATRLQRFSVRQLQRQGRRQ